MPAVLKADPRLKAARSLRVHPINRSASAGRRRQRAPHRLGRRTTPTFQDGRAEEKSSRLEKEKPNAPVLLWDVSSSARPLLMPPFRLLKPSSGATMPPEAGTEAPTGALISAEGSQGKGASRHTHTHTHLGTRTHTEHTHTQRGVKNTQPVAAQCPSSLLVPS